MDPTYNNIITPQTNVSNKGHSTYQIGPAPDLNFIHEKNKTINNGQSIDNKILEEMVSTIQTELIQLIRDIVQKSSTKIESEESLLEFVLKYSEEIISYSK